MSSPSNFAPAEIQFNKLDDLPNKGKGKPHTAADIMKAMKVLHQMIHKQAEHYGGKHSKLLPAGIAEEAPTFKTFLKLCATVADSE